MAGTASERASDLNESFSRPDIRAVFCVRGGAGSLAILPYLDYDLIAENPKPVFGLSDSTALQNALYARTKNVSYSGFLPVYDFKNGTPDTQVQQSLQDILCGKKQRLYAGKALKIGQAQGIAVGGCLSVFCTLCGSSYFPDLNGKILFLEDVGEKTYKLETFLTQLSLQKGFGGLKGLVFGQFKNCMEADAGDGSVAEILADFTQNLPVPVIADFPYGHEKSRYLLPVGGKLSVCADPRASMLEYL
jgi:muramoyltetrapeptide carboxypeptidase